MLRLGKNFIFFVISTYNLSEINEVFIKGVLDESSLSLEQNLVFWSTLNLADSLHGIVRVLVSVEGELEGLAITGFYGSVQGQDVEHLLDRDNRLLLVSLLLLVRHEGFQLALRSWRAGGP